MQLTRSTVKDVMVPLRDVFTIESSTVLDRSTIARIVKSGFSRIPVYDTSVQVGTAHRKQKEHS